MLTFTSLKVKCPLCDSSLIDEKNLVDNEPSIKLNIVWQEKNGIMRLSSLYGSYNFFSIFDIPVNTAVEFYCPYCNGKIVSDSKCELCSSPLIPLRISDGGTVSFCSRRGCKKHFIEFEDIDRAIRLLNDEYAYASAGFKKEEKPVKVGIHNRTSEDKVGIQKRTGEDVVKGLIRSKTYLFSYCPQCKKTLIDEKAWKFAIEKENGEKGFLWMNPYLNEFAHITSVVMPESSLLKDIGCFHCHSSLLEQDKSCPLCSSPIAKAMVVTPFKIIDFHICTKKGCRWHGISEEDMQIIELDENKE